MVKNRYDAIWLAYEKLTNYLRYLEGLPLSVASISPVSPFLRRTEVTLFFFRFAFVSIVSMNQSTSAANLKLSSTWSNLIFFMYQVLWILLQFRLRLTEFHFRDCAIVSVWNILNCWTLLQPFPPRCAESIDDESSKKFGLITVPANFSSPPYLPTVEGCPNNILMCSQVMVEIHFFRFFFLSNQRILLFQFIWRWNTVVSGVKVLMRSII